METVDQKRMVSLDWLQLALVAWLLAWHAMFDVFTLFHASLGEGRQPGDYLTELRLALYIVGAAAVLIRHPSFMPIAVGCLLQVAFHYFFTIVESSALLSKGGSVMCTKQQQEELESSCLTTDVLRLMCLVLAVIALLLAAMNIALRCKDPAPLSQNNKNTETLVVVPKKQPSTSKVFIYNGSIHCSNI